VKIIALVLNDKDLLPKNLVVVYSGEEKGFG